MIYQKDLEQQRVINNMYLPTYELEDMLMSKGYKHICGVDEVGRGALASSVVAAAVIVPTNIMPLLIGKVNDSKKLSQKKRAELSILIKKTCDYGIGEVNNKYIDETNILKSTLLAMNLAVAKLKYVDYILVDGNTELYNCPIDQQTIIKGDSRSISIAAASIIAKEYRDDTMRSLDSKYPNYGFAKHKGYGTKQHREALKKYGPCDLHRLTFRGVR